MPDKFDRLCEKFGADAMSGGAKGYIAVIVEKNVTILSQGLTGFDLIGILRSIARIQGLQVQFEFSEPERMVRDVE